MKKINYSLLVVFATNDGQNIELCAKHTFKTVQIVLGENRNADCYGCGSPNGAIKPGSIVRWLFQEKAIFWMYTVTPTSGATRTQHA